MISTMMNCNILKLSLIPEHNICRDGKSCKRCKRCWCKNFTTGVKILVESVIKGGVNFFYFVANHALLV